MQKDCAKIIMCATLYIYLCIIYYICCFSNGVTLLKKISQGREKKPQKHQFTHLHISYETHVPPWCKRSNKKKTKGTHTSPSTCTTGTIGRAGERNIGRVDLYVSSLIPPPFIWSYFRVSGIERLQVVEAAIGCLCVSRIDRQQSEEAATGYVLLQSW